MGNILNHNREIFDIKLSKTDYWDHHIYLSQKGDEIYNDDLQEECLAAYIDTNLDECRDNNNLQSLSEYQWDEAVNNGVALNNIGLTGMDNGLITFDKDTITEEEFLKLYTESTLEIDKDDKRLILTPVSGNNKLYNYPLEITKDNDIVVSQLNGGFYQGFFQLNDGCDYKVLPKTIDKGWVWEFTIKPQNQQLTIDSEIPTLNEIYPENKGIFFYIGTRAENKWYKYYNRLTEDDSELRTDNSLELDEYQYQYTTDNKFITYNRTPEGLRANETYDDETITIIRNHERKTDNYFLTMHRGENGYTATNPPLNKEVSYDYDILKDIIENAFALQVKENGSVGYKYLIRDCEQEEEYDIVEEFSYPNIITNNEWNIITVRVQPIVQNALDMYNYVQRYDKMRLLVYVNGKLVLASKELPMLNLRKLNDEYTKQEGVPYNISLGGGTQGLIDVIYENYTEIPNEILYLERHFAGSFIGLFKSFKFYTCDKNYNQINANYRFEKKNL